MKKLIILISLLVPFMANAQDTTEQETFVLVEKMPEFPGGSRAMDSFFRTNFTVPAEAAEVGASGRIYLEFVVETDGSMSELKILKDGVGWGCAEEALRVLQLIANIYTWTPGEQKGKPVRVRYRYPVDIKMKGKAPKKKKGKN